MEKDWKTENTEYKNVKRQSHRATREKRDKKLEFEDSVLVVPRPPKLTSPFRHEKCKTHKLEFFVGPGRCGEGKECGCV